MMMCIGSVRDFEAQLKTAEALERAERTSRWLWSRRYQDKGIGLGLLHIEPPRPYSHGRRFIPAWLAAEREFYMAASITCDYHGDETRHLLHGLVRVNIDPSMMVRRK